MAGSLMMIALVSLMLSGWALTLFGLPGNWLIVLTSGFVWYFSPLAGAITVGGFTVIALITLAVVAEAVEWLSTTWGMGKLGASKQAGILALVGSIAGGLSGAGLGLPIPVVGPVLGLILLSALGAMAGAMLGEIWAGKSWQKESQSGSIAILGRLAGSAAKITIASIMVVKAGLPIIID